MVGRAARAPIRAIAPELTIAFAHKIQVAANPQDRYPDSRRRDWLVKQVGYAGLDLSPTPWQSISKSSRESRYSRLLLGMGTRTPAI